MKYYVAYCMLHKCWMTKDELKLRCQHLDKQHIKFKKKKPESKCQYLIWCERIEKDE